MRAGHLDGKLTHSLSKCCLYDRLVQCEDALVNYSVGNPSYIEQNIFGMFRSMKYTLQHRYMLYIIHYHIYPLLILRYN